MSFASVGKVCVLSLMVLVGSAVASAQSWGDLARKAKQKAQDTINGAGQPATTPASPATVTQGNQTTIHRFLRLDAIYQGRQTIFLSAVYAADPSLKTLKDENQQFTDYIVQKYGVEPPKANHGPSMFQNRMDSSLQDSRETIATHSNGAPVVSSDWTYNGALAIALDQPVASSGAGQAAASQNSLAPSRRDNSGGISDATAQTFNTEIDGYLVGKPYRENLLAMKYHPELVTTEVAQSMAGWLMYIEPGVRQDAGLYTTNPQNRIPNTDTFNRAHPAFFYDWSELVKSNPTLANGAALDPFLRPDLDWSFLETTPGWDNIHPQAWVGIVVLPSEAGRDVTFAAHEVAPIMKQQLLAAAKRESNKLWYPLTLTGYTYDMDAQILRFGAQDIAENVPLPDVKGAATASGYNSFKLQSRVGEVQRMVGNHRKTFPELDRWRAMLGWKCSPGGLALDRQLRLSTVPLDIKTAEAAHIHTGGGLSGRLFITVDRVEVDPGSQMNFVMFAHVDRIDLTTKDGRVLASISGAALPKPRAIP